MTRLVVVGDSVLDRDVEGSVERLSPDAPVPVVDAAGSSERPGGAALAAVLAARDGADVALLTALGDDRPGRAVRRALGELGVSVADLGLAGPTPEKVRVQAQGQTLLRVDHGGEGGEAGPLGERALALLDGAEAILVSDYGRGVAAQPQMRSELRRLAERTPLVWDPHPRGPAPVPGAALVTPNEREASAFAAGAAEGDSPAAQAARGQALAGRWSARRVCITLGARGALVAGGGLPPAALPAEPIAGGDSCGAGDRFASRAALALGEGTDPLEAAAAAVLSASAFVAAGGAAAALGAAEEEVLEEALEAPAADRLPACVSRVRTRGGTVVATGGCFDLLHAGHVHTLEAARRLGDCLVVCLNSDASVARLKGPDRPLVSQADRAAVLRALGCVGAVLIFDEDTPEAVLRRLRPNVWAKGGDYADGELPEARALEEWGGQTVLLPYVEGQSTTRLIAEAAVRG